MITRSSTRLAETTENEVDGSNSNYVQSVQSTRRTMSRISQDRNLQNRIVLSRNESLNNLNSTLTQATTSTLANEESSEGPFQSSSSVQSKNNKDTNDLLQISFKDFDKHKILSEMLKYSKNEKFPKKYFTNNGKKFGYTSYLHFTRSVDETNSKKQKIIFECIFCDIKISAFLGATSNVKTHLERHNDVTGLMNWFAEFNQSCSTSNKMKINKMTIRLVKYFIGSNSAFNELDSPFFRELFKDTSFEIPCSKTFSEKILPEVFEMVNKQIDIKLNKAFNICLICDIWTNKQMKDFLGVACNLTFENFEKEILVIGMIEMPGRHTAENIKMAIESLINRFSFDKSKISACSTDEGSNFVRLFKPKYIPIQNLDELSDEEDITEYPEDTLEEIENEKEYNEQGHLDTIKSVKVESLEFEKELGEVIKHFDEKKYDNKIDISNRTVQSNNVQIYFDESQEYNFEFGARGEPFYELSLQIGSDEIPRISCACHKNNIAVRMAIQKSPQLSKLLRKLSGYASKHKNSINSSRFFIKQKARLRIENKTRWSSSFLMLDSFHKALKKQAFPPEDPCPVSLEVLELYLQILQPAFLFNLIMQKSKSSIADVLPALNIMLSKWNRMQVTGTYRQLCDYLICAFKMKFKDEISSSVYCVASLLNVSKLTWMSRPDCSTMKKNALDSLVNVAKQVTQKKSKQQSNHQNHLNETVVSSGTVDSLAECMRDDDYLSETEVESEITNYEIEKEKIYFIQNVIDKNSFKCNSTAKFWIEKNKEMPILKKIAIILLNIPSSSAYIERFYSICGLVCKTNCGNMSSSTIIQRSTLKANIDILDSFNI